MCSSTGGKRLCLRWCRKCKAGARVWAPGVILGPTCLALPPSSPVGAALLKGSHPSHPAALFHPPIAPTLASMMMTLRRLSW